MSKIVQIEIKNLFGYLDYKIPLNTTDNITIIHGPNGSGKTWILQLIKAVFSLDYSGIRKAPVGEIAFRFQDGGHFAVRRHVEEHPGLYPPLYRPEWIRPSFAKLIFSYSSKRTKKPKEFTFELPRSIDDRGRHFPLSMIEREIPHLERIGPQEWMDLSRNQVLSAQEVEVIYGRRLPWTSTRETTPQWLIDLTKRVNINYIQSQRLLQVPTPGTSRESASRKDVIQMVELYSGQLADKISKTLAESVKIAQSRDKTFPTRLLRGEVSKVPSESELRKELANLEYTRKQLYSAGLLDEEESVPLPKKAMSEMEKKVLSLYLHDVKEKLHVFDDIQTRIATLMFLINSKIEAQGKSLVIDRDKGFLFRSKFGTEKILRPTDLSSGEQHQVVLFFELLFKASNKAFILIDEPEISLNVGWQRRFLDDLLKVIQLCDYSILMATHSPQIIHNRWDLAVPLSGGVKE